MRAFNGERMEKKEIRKQGGREGGRNEGGKEKGRKGGKEGNVLLFFFSPFTVIDSTPHQGHSPFFK